MADCDQGNSHALHIRVEVALHVNRHCGCTLIEDGILRLMVDKSGHSDSLFLTSREHIVPIGVCVPATLAANQIFQAHFSQDALEDVLAGTACFHLLN